MKLRRQRQGIPGLNTTATADISFILLIFFLVTTSMDVDKGLMRQLPPKHENQQKNETTIDKENLLAITIDENGVVSKNDTVCDIKNLTVEIANFLQMRGAEHLITIDADPDCSYEPYFKVQNSVLRAYALERNRLAMTRFKHNYLDCDAEQRDVIMDLCPQRVAENYRAREEKL